jgi:hypothetical protein
MRLLADMNISPLTVERLRGRGFDIVRLTEILPANTPDRIIWNWLDRKAESW